MNAQMKEESTSLLPIESINAVELFTGKKLDDLLVQIRQETATLVPDLTTVSGRKEIASVAYKVARSKTAIDDAGKELVAEWKKQSAVVDASRKKARDYLDALRDEVRAPLDEWEAEEARKEQEAVEAARIRREAEEAERLAEIERREAVVREAEERIAAQAKAEADRIAAEEAEKARVAREEQVRAEAAEQAKREAAESVARAEKAEADAIEAARLAAEKAERDQAEAVRQAELRAQLEADRKEADRLAAEARQQAEDERRAANKRHCAGVNRKARDAFITEGFDEEEATRIVTAIASGKVPGVIINY